jgi:hypothetical protein
MKIRAKHGQIRDDKVAEYLAQEKDMESRIGRPCASIVNISRRIGITGTVRHFLRASRTKSSVEVSSLVSTATAVIASGSSVYRGVTIPTGHRNGGTLAGSRYKRLRLLLCARKDG